MQRLPHNSWPKLSATLRCPVEPAWLASVNPPDEMEDPAPQGGVFMTNAGSVCTSCMYLADQSSSLLLRQGLVLRTLRKSL